MFDNIAGSYDFLNHFLSLGIDRMWRKKAIKFLAQFSPASIIDIATGTGDFAFESLAINPGRIVGLDLSEKMLDVARVKNQKQGTAIEFIKGDSERMPFGDNCFDGMTVGFGVRNFDDLKGGLKEMHRILKVGGNLVILEISEPQSFPLKHLYGLYFHYILPGIGKIFSKDNRAYKYLPESVARFPEGKAFVDILKECGFKNAKHKPLTFGICAMYTCEK